MAKYSRSFAELKTILFFLLLLQFSFSSLVASSQTILPYRFLLVVSTQWDDPASYLVEGRDEFRILVTLLKNWGLPFDILRLDQQNFDRYHLTDREGAPRYSTIIWDADPTDLKGEDLRLLPILIKKHAVNLVILGLSFSGEHFITRGIKQREGEFLDRIDFYAYGNKVTLTSATAIVKRSHLPFLTVREFKNAGRVVWLGVHRQKAQINIQIMRDLFKRCLVWANGYALYTEYPKSILLFMDDFGTSDRTYLPYWNYRTLNKDDIHQGIIKPLKKHSAVLNLNIVSGYVDRKTQKIVSPWKQKVIDEIDGETVHDYISAKRGLDEALREGVIEIQSHGYTHMLPDLESPPGPFWMAPMDGEGTLGWDYEFGDPVRNTEVPAITQKFLLARGLEYIRKDFAVEPLFVINGGHAWSHSYPNNSPRIAARMGFGLCHFNSPGYLGKDMVIPSMEPVVLSGGWKYDQKLTGNDIPWTIDSPYFLIFHDRDVSMDTNALENLLTNLSDDIRYMSANEYCGYLHALVAKSTENHKSLCLTIDYDPHYGKHFDSHESRWTLHLSDVTRSKFEEITPEKKTIIVPKGLGQHNVCVGTVTK